MTAWQLYWLTRLDGLKNITVVLAVICAASVFIGFVAMFIGAADQDAEPISFGRRMRNMFWIPALALTILWVLIPSTKAAAFIVVAPKLYSAVSQNKEIRELPTKVVELANAWIEELKPEKEK